MKLTKSKLKQIIKEELQNILQEEKKKLPPIKVGKKSGVRHRNQCPGSPYSRTEWVNACGKPLTGGGWLNGKSEDDKYCVYKQHGKIKCGPCWTPCWTRECRDWCIKKYPGHKWPIPATD